MAAPGLGAVLIAALVTGGTAMAVQPDEVLADPALEARAREISRELRCLVCQNQSIDDSDAELARDLRLLVRERLMTGDSDQAVLDYVTSRYGDFVLLEPPFRPDTYALWLGPAVIVGAGAVALAAVLRRRRRAAAEALAPLSAEEERRIADLLADEQR